MEQPKLNYGMFTEGVEKIAQDLSKETEEVFTEVPPFAYDEETGEFLNKSSFPKLVKTGEVNVQERIQSYIDDVDIYKILEKVAISGDSTLMNRSVGFYGDISTVPDNIHAFDDYVTSNLATLKKLDPNLANIVLKENATEADIKAAIDNYVSSIIKVKEEKKEEGVK